MLLINNNLKKFETAIINTVRIIPTVFIDLKAS
jgi:hypothetical protein